MAHTETTSEGFLSRLMGSIGGVLGGGALFLLSFPLLFWNEGRAVRTAQSLEEGAGAVVSVAAERVDPGSEGRLVHVSGEATTAETLSDPELGVQAAGAIKLIRRVEMYQWVEEKKSETRKKLGGGTETVTTYEYKKAWEHEPVDSSGFKEAGHENPGAFAIEARETTARKVTLGAFALSDGLVARLDRSEELRVDPAALAAVPMPLREGLRAANGGFYRGQDPAAPALGDVRLSFQVVKPATVSLVARQVRGSFEPYQAKAGDSILLLEYGVHSADAMFQSAQQANTVFTWILRGVGFFVMFIGLALVFRPLSVLADVLPILGSLVGVGVGLVAFLMAGALSLFTIAIAWVVYRPLLGVALLVLGAAALAAVIMLAIRARGAVKRVQD